MRKYYHIIIRCHHNLILLTSTTARSIASVMEKNKYSVAFDFKEVKSASEDDSDSDTEIDDTELKGDPGSLHKSSVLSRSKYIPLRLSLAERKMLRLVESAMKCSEYTTNVDSKFKNEAKRTHKMLQGITGVLHGLVMSCNYEAGQRLAEEKVRTVQSASSGTF